LQTQRVFQKRGRDRLSIIAEILNVALEGSPKTQIMYRANLSFTQLNFYLSLLLKCKLAERISTKESLLYKTTSKGMWFLKAHREINELLTPESVKEAIGKPSVVALIPAYNDEKNIAEAILKTGTQVDQIIVCDDGSTDMTKEIAERMGARVVRSKVNEGKGAALRCLFEEAKDLDADVVIILDGDERFLQPDEIQRLIQPILSGQADFAMSAEASEEAVTRNIPMYRKLGSKAFNRLVSIIAGKKLSSTQSNARAVSRRVVENLVISKGTNVDTEMFMQANKKGWVVAEVPTGCKYVGRR
jgi:predicted transcriptional regulator/CTP:molybdopterin cytidylyltransferase MocA